MRGDRDSLLARLLRFWFSRQLARKPKVLQACFPLKTLVKQADINDASFEISATSPGEAEDEEVFRRVNGGKGARDFSSSLLQSGFLSTTNVPDMPDDNYSAGRGQKCTLAYIFGGPTSAAVQPAGDDEGYS